MKNVKSWKPLIISIIATPILLLMGVSSVGAGHGNYFLAKVLFPFSILTMLFLNSITLPFILSIVQFPFYGLVFTISNKKKNLLTITTIAIHILAVITCFVLINDSFS